MGRGRGSRLGSILGGALLALALAGGGAAGAESFPSKPIHLVVPYAPGGAVDVVSRTVGNALTQKFGWTVLVENRTGAGGIIASAFVAKAEPDGYTLLTASNATSVNGSLYANLTYDPASDFAPVVLLARGPIVLTASPALPVTSVRALIQHAKAHPGALNFGSGGVGTSGSCGERVGLAIASALMVPAWMCGIACSRFEKNSCTWFWVSAWNTSAPPR